MPKQLEILLNPNPILRKKSELVEIGEILKPEFQTLLADMAETMKRKDGAGLAAPQIGKNIRVVIIQNNDNVLFLINPQITKKSWARETEEEGCLSVLNNKGEIIYALVERYKKVNCIYLDEKGNKKKLIAEKLFARAVQHEIDHLNGILFIDRIAQPNNRPTKK